LVKQKQKQKNNFIKELFVIEYIIDIDTIIFLTND